MSYITSNWRLYKQRAFCYAARCLLYNKNLCYIAHPSQPSRWIYSGMARNRRGTIFGLWRCAVGEVTTAETRWRMRWPHCEFVTWRMRSHRGQALDNVDISLNKKRVSQVYTLSSPGIYHLKSIQVHLFQGYPWY